LPTVVWPSMKPKFDEKLILKLNILTVENKPEAPWIKRTDKGIVFTDNICELSEDLDFSESKKSSELNLEKN